MRFGLPIPKNVEDFEILCCQLLRHVWKRPAPPIALACATAFKASSRAPRSVKRFLSRHRIWKGASTFG